MFKVGMVVKEINYFHENESKTEKFSKIKEIDCSKTYHPITLEDGQEYEIDGRGIECSQITSKIVPATKEEIEKYKEDEKKSFVFWELKKFTNRSSKVFLDEVTSEVVDKLYPVIKSMKDEGIL